MRVLLGVLAFSAGIGAALALAASAWKRATAAMVGSLGNDPSTGTHRSISREAPPAPVARFLERALSKGPTGARLAIIRHRGEFRSSEGTWSPFESTEYFAASPPGFVWDARIRMGPGLGVRVRDGYVHGEGSMQAKILGLVPVLDAEGRRELGDGALQRYLAEGVWFPEALLPRPGLEWRAIDEATAEATLSHGTHQVSLTFRFTEAGEVLSAETDARYRELEGEYLPTPWRGRFWRWERRGPFRIPVEGEVAWVLPEGPHPYWRGSIVGYELVAR